MIIMSFYYYFSLLLERKPPKYTRTAPLLPYQTLFRPRMCSILLAGQLQGSLDDREQHVDLVHVLDALGHERDTLEAHLGVDVLLGQRARDVEVLLAADGAELVLHEDQVPELAVAVLGREVAVGAIRWPAVDQDPRARYARAGHATRTVADRQTVEAGKRV